MGLSQVPAIAPVTSVDGTAGRTTSSGGTTPVLDLATSGVSATTYGSASLIPSLTVDTYGRVTSATTNAFSAGALSLISSQTLSGSSVSLSSIPQSYKHLRLTLTNLTTNIAGSLIITFNNTSGTGNNTVVGASSTTNTGFSVSTITSGQLTFLYNNVPTSNNGIAVDMHVYAYTTTSGWHQIQGSVFTANAGLDNRWFTATPAKNGALTSLTISSSQSFTGGVVSLYGIS
jgi:hypothetical protein